MQFGTISDNFKLLIAEREKYSPPENSIASHTFSVYSRGRNLMAAYASAGVQ